MFCQVLLEEVLNLPPLEGLPLGKNQKDSEEVHYWQLAVVV